MSAHKHMPTRLGHVVNKNTVALRGAVELHDLDTEALRELRVDVGPRAVAYAEADRVGLVQLARRLVDQVAAHLAHVREHRHLVLHALAPELARAELAPQHHGRPADHCSPAKGYTVFKSIFSLNI